MNEQEKKTYLEKYREAKKKGVPFFPDIIFKDAVISLIIFIVLVALAYFVGAPLEARANPADTSYTPRPEWYFLFLFQLLKYIPGNLEVIGVVLIPTLAVLLLFLLPFLDRSTRRHFMNRPVITATVALGVVSIVFLTIQSVREAPPPAEAALGDQTAALYAANCAPCHGPSIDVPSVTNLHDVIIQGKHEGMPAWGADLSTDQIDALAGFILSPDGSTLFTKYCASCHEAPELVSSNPLELKRALDQGLSYKPHINTKVQDWSTVMSPEQRTRLLNFLVAPDGARLFTTNCSPCHGSSVAFSGSEDELRTLISKGGLHLEMPPWQEKLSSSETDALAKYVVDPKSNPSAGQAFNQNCKKCHGDRIPSADSFDQARQTIAGGGAHQTMPVWGDILTSEQLDALVRYTLQAAEGSPVELGQQLFAQNCSPCHGDFGEGGPNPGRAGDTILPISSAEFLKTRDDFTLRAIIAQGQPNFGMSPFGNAFGGPLDDDEVDAIVVYMRSWEANPPVFQLAEIATPIPVITTITGAEVYADLCAQCHAPKGEGGIGSALNDPQFQKTNTDQDIFNAIDLGQQPSAMIAWGKFLTVDQIDQLVKFIRSLSAVGPSTIGTSPTFTADVLPIFQAKCVLCHGTLGGWDASNYSAVMSTGNHAPVVIAGAADNSLLVQKLLGTQKEGTVMPPSGKLSEAEIQIIINWINTGALE